MLSRSLNMAPTKLLPHLANCVIAPMSIHLHIIIVQFISFDLFSLCSLDHRTTSYSCHSQCSHCSTVVLGMCAIDSTCGCDVQVSVSWVDSTLSSLLHSIVPFTSPIQFRNILSCIERGTQGKHSILKFCMM